jgi:hypothetical protein
VLDVVDDTVASGLWTDEGTTPVEALSGEHTSELIPEFLVGTEKITNLASTGTNITGYNDEASIKKLIPKIRLHVPGTSVLLPMCLQSSIMKELQKRLISLSDLPLGSKSEPPFPPPMERPVRAFLNVCSKPKNLRIERLTEG